MQQLFVSIIPLFDPPVILLQSIVKVAVGPVEHVTAKGLADRPRVGVMSIGCHPFWGVTNHIDGLLEKTLGRFHISLLTDHRINQIAILIDGPIQKALFSLDLGVGFIHVP